MITEFAKRIGVPAPQRQGRGRKTEQTRLRAFYLYIIQQKRLGY
jgi:hypothetical protein